MNPLGMLYVVPLGLLYVVPPPNEKGPKEKKRIDYQIIVDIWSLPLS